MDLGSILAFWGISALFVVTPGADWAYAITAGLRGRTVPAVLGLLLGHAIATLVVAAGVGALVAEFPVVLDVLTVCGALYLVWLGVGTLRNPSSVHADDAVSTASRARWFAKGIGVSGLNPKVFLLFLALLPQFTDPAASLPLPVQIVLLGAVHGLSCAVVYFAVAYCAKAVLGARPAAARIVSRVSGALMIAIGVFLVVERVVELLA